MIQKSSLGLSILLLCFCFSISCGKKTPVSDREKESYASGAQLARGLQSAGLQLDSRFVEQGFRDVFSGNLALTEQEIQEALVRLTNEAQRARASNAAENLKNAQRYIEKMMLDPGFKKTPSGLLYKELKAGAGPKPQKNDSVRLHYSAFTSEGQLIDSSVQRGQVSEIKVDAVIPGWREVLPMMTIGSKWEIVVPPSLAYGESGSGNVAPNSALRFELELLEIRQR